MLRRRILLRLPAVVGPLLAVAGLVVVFLLGAPNVAIWSGIGLLALGAIGWAMRRWNVGLLETAEAAVAGAASLLGSTRSSSPGGAISAGFRTVGVLLAALAVTCVGLQSWEVPLNSVTLSNSLFIVALLALLQQVILNWLHSGPSAREQSILVGIALEARDSAKTEIAAAGSGSHEPNRRIRSWSGYMVGRRGSDDDDDIYPKRVRRLREELEHYERRLREDHQDRGGNIDDHELRLQKERLRRLREDLEREEREYAAEALLHRREQIMHVERQYYPERSILSVLRPLYSVESARINFRTALRHGLVIDEVWPRLDLVVPRDAKNRLRRDDFAIAACRLLATEIISCYIVGEFISLIRGFATAWLLPVSVAFLGAVGIVITGTRRRVHLAYQRRADVIELYRFDLVRAMRLPQPRSQAEFVAITQVLVHGVRNQGLQYAVADPSSANSEAIELSGRRLDELRTQLAREIPEQVIAEVTSALENEREAMLRRISPVVLEPRDLELLTSTMVERTLSSISAVVSESLASLSRQVRDEVQASIANVISGPALINFAGYLVLESRPATGNGTLEIRNGQITTTAGSRLELSMIIICDERAKTSGQERGADDEESFLALQPINIESGVDSGTSVEFDAIIDSPTLTVYPHRSKMIVSSGQSAQVSLVTVLPKDAGRHELWFQLYQSGHLIEVVAVAVEARAHSSSV